MPAPRSRSATASRSWWIEARLVRRSSNSEGGRASSQGARSEPGSPSRHSGMVREHQTSDAQLRIGESRDSGFAPRNDSSSPHERSDMREFIERSSPDIASLIRATQARNCGRCKPLARPVIPGWSEGPDPESRDSQMCNCTSQFALCAPRNDRRTKSPVAGPGF